MTEPTPAEPTTAGPATLATVSRAIFGTDVPPAAERSDVVDAVDAVNSWIATRPHLAPVAGSDPPEWVPHHRYGARLLAARIYRRKDSPAGVLQGYDGAVYVQRNDPDVAQLLGLGAYRKPRIG